MNVNWKAKCTNLVRIFLSETEGFYAPPMDVR